MGSRMAKLAVPFSRGCLEHPQQVYSYSDCPLASGLIQELAWLSC